MGLKFAVRQFRLYKCHPKPRNEIGTWSFTREEDHS